MRSSSRLRSLLRQLLHLQESPHRTALAFALGVFFTFSPPYGLHMMMAVFCAWAFRLNFVALLAGLCVNTPWTIVAVLGGTLWLGCLLLGVPFPTSLDWGDTSPSAIFNQVKPYLLPFIVGGTVLSLAAGLLAYPIAYWLITRYRERPGGEVREAPLPPSRGLG